MTLLRSYGSICLTGDLKMSFLEVYIIWVNILLWFTKWFIPLMFQLITDVLPEAVQVTSVIFILQLGYMVRLKEQWMWLLSTNTETDRVVCRKNDLLICIYINIKERPPDPGPLSWSFPRDCYLQLHQHATGSANLQSYKQD